MTEAETLIFAVGNCGVRLSVEGDSLVYRGPRGALDAEMIARLKASKAALVAELCKTKPVQLPLPDPAGILERAAILEFCEGLPRTAADARALAEAGFATWDALALRLSEYIDHTSERQSTP